MKDTTIRLKPCGKAVVKLVDKDGKPHVGARIGLQYVMTPGPTRFSLTSESLEMAADEDFPENLNFDRTGENKTNKSGEITYGSLIPGVTYRFLNFDQGQSSVEKEFIAEPEKVFDLGTIVIDLGG